MVKLMFLSERIEDVEQVRQCLLEDVLVIIYNPITDSISKLEKILSSEMFKTNKITNVGWIFHSPSNISDGGEVLLFKDIELSNKIKKSSLKKLTYFFKLVEEVFHEKVEVPRFDLLACCLLKNPQFQTLRMHLLEELKNDNCRMEIAASDDLTGSVYHAQTGVEQDWILESHNINLIGLYFKEEIERYPYHFKGNPIQDFQQNIGNGMMSAVQGDWEGAINSMGSALLMAPTTLPIVGACKQMYQVLQDPMVQTIFDCIPGLNVVSYSVRMGNFIAKAAKGEASDWDIALCVLDSVSLVSGFAVPGPKPTGTVINSTVRTASNITKVKNLAKSSLNVLQYSKDIGEITQTLIENPSEDSIDKTALSVAKIAVSAGISKGKMREQLKVALDTTNAAGFYAISEITKRADAAYDSAQQNMINAPSVALFEHTNYSGVAFNLKQNTSKVSFGDFSKKCSSIRIPPRTAVRLWVEPNFQGQSYDWCNWNWSDMHVNWIGIEANDKFTSGLCVRIQDNGAVVWEI